METAINLSAYQISWIEFRPAKGVATKGDIKKILCNRYTRQGADPYTKALYAHFPSPAKAAAFLDSLNGISLTKKYECRIFRDKQFGLRNKETGYAVPFTSKQNDEVVVIG